ncbi:MAG: phosphoribosylamine--glycine ligase [Candidatus Dormiibacterota bacterium]
MKLLITGSGAREHALAWKCAQSPLVDEVLLCPGNGGTAGEFRNLPIAADDPARVVAAARREAVGLVVLGPEASVAAGVGDALRAAGIACFGPDAAAGRIETSKAFAKELMQQAGIPTAAFGVFDDPVAATVFAGRYGGRVAVKADGLAQGKGVVLCDTVEQVAEVAGSMIRDRAFGAAGARVVVEQLLVGPELSVFGISDGTHVAALPAARDFKRALDGDRGLNTGGMGAYSPPAGVDDALLAQIERTVLQPTVDALGARGIVYRGVLYAGLMLTPAGPSVLEFNCRFGDPETQVILPRLAGDLVPLLRAAANGDVRGLEVAISPRPAVGVVVASGGYPGAYATGYAISGLDRLAPGTLCFHAGTARDGANRVITSGGRVLTVTSLGESVADARGRAQADAGRVAFPGAFHRRDIAQEQESKRDR